MSRIGILGSGDVGQTLAAGFQKHGHQVRIASRAPDKLGDFTLRTGIQAGSFGDIAAWGEILVLCVKGTAALDAVALAGPDHLRGKVVLDTTNPISHAPPVDGVLQFFTGPNDSLLEQIQAACPGARLVKVFNSVGSDRMVDPQLAGGPPTMFYCGNDEEARGVVRGILQQFGWEPADMGTAVAARAIEPLCLLWCIPGFRDNVWGHAFKVLWGENLRQRD